MLVSIAFLAKNIWECLLQCHTGGDHDVLAIDPGDGQGVVGHGTAPGEAGPANVDGGNDLDDSLVVGVGRCVGRHGHTVRDLALLDPELCELDASRGVSGRDGVDREVLGNGCGYEKSVM